MDKQRAGILLDTSKLSLQAALRRALALFEARPDLQGLTPEEVFFAPGEAPPDLTEIMGLHIYTDDRGIVRPSFIRVTTRPLSELERERAHFAFEVSSTAYLAA